MEKIKKRGPTSPLLFPENKGMNRTDLVQALEEKLTGSPLFIVEVDVQPTNRVKVLIDGDEGVTIDQCAEINRFILQRFDRDQEDYALEVSSPGLGQPLRLLRQYQKNIGRNLEVQLKDGTVTTGTLESVTDEHIVLKPKSKKKKAGAQSSEEAVSLNLAMADISAAKVALAF